MRSKAQICSHLIAGNTRFEYRWRHGHSSVVFVACCASSGFCSQLITHSEKSYWALCVLNCVWSRNSKSEVAHAQAEVLCLLLDCWVCMFEYQWGYGHLIFCSLCRLQPLQRGSFIQRSPTECVCVCSRNFNNEVAWAQAGLLCHRNKKRKNICQIKCICTIY